jgi:hypothetical protein
MLKHYPMYFFSIEKFAVFWRIVIMNPCFIGSYDVVQKTATDPLIFLEAMKKMSLQKQYNAKDLQHFLSSKHNSI